jgi:hypothetical protein
MSYWVEDANGFVVDFATNVGIMDHVRDKTLPKSLRTFLESGEADQALLDAIRKELASNLHWIGFANAIKSAVAPMILTDGCGSLQDRQKTEAEGDEELPPDDWSEPFDDEERRAAVEKLKLSPLSVDEVREILYSKNPWGLTWEQQLSKSSKMVADPAALANALAEGIAAEDSLPKLRKRIEPFVENLSVSAQRIARTEGLRVPMASQQRQYDRADAGGAKIKGMRLHCSMGPHSAPDHKKRNGKWYPKIAPGQYVAADGEPYPGTPYGHPNCMCWGTPEFDLS